MLLCLPCSCIAKVILDALSLRVAYQEREASWKDFSIYVRKIRITTFTKLKIPSARASSLTSSSLLVPARPTNLLRPEPIRNRLSHPLRLRRQLRQRLRWDWRLPRPRQSLVEKFSNVHVHRQPQVRWIAPQNIRPPAILLLP